MDMFEKPRRGDHLCLHCRSQETACTDVYQMVHWVCSTLKVFASQHAQLLLHVDAKPEVC